MWTDCVIVCTCVHVHVYIERDREKYTLVVRIISTGEYRHVWARGRRKSDGTQEMPILSVLNRRANIT